MLQMHHWASVKDKVGKEKKKKIKEEVKYTDSWNKRCYLEMLNEFSGLYFMFDSSFEMKQRASCRPFSVPFCWGGDDIGFLVLAKALIIGREPGLWFLGLEQGEWIQLLI